MSKASRSAPSRARLFAGVAAVTLGALAAHPALAQEAMATAPASAKPPPADDGLGQRGFYLEADLLIQDDKAKVVTARGNVEVRYRGRTLRAGELVYDQASGVVSAKDKVVIVDPSGATTFADAVVLDDELTAGIAKGFSARLEGNVKIAADTAVRRSDTVQELNKAIYTPCEICAEDKTRPPSWSIKADKVVEDKSRQLIYYRNATIELFGVPVFFAPVFWQADPSAERKSGLLPPKIQGSKRRGLSYEQPYYQVISPSEDLTISPQINTKVNPFLNLDWRKRFYSGTVEARFGYTYEKDLTGDGDRIGDLTSRSYILADGRFDIDKNWKWGFSAERASEDLIFQKYDIDDVYTQRGLVASDDKRLTSQLYATRQDNRSWFSVDMISIQGLRPSDIDRTIPTIAPLIEGRWEPDSPVLGGRLRLQGSAVALTRDQSQFLASDPGIDSRRASGLADWRGSFTTSYGLRVSPFAQVRADAYSISDRPGGLSDASVTRVVGVAGLDFSMPFIRRDGDRTIVLEPLAQIALSPDTDNDPRIPNEDSIVFEFDETNLLRADKSPGFDIYEGGQRVNLGGRASVIFDDGRSASLLVGRSYRSEFDPGLPARTGLQTTSSDWIVAGEVTPILGVSLFSRARLDSDTLNVRRLEAGADVLTDRAWGYVRYLRDNQDISGVQREDVDFSGQVLVSGNFGVTFGGIRDIENDVWRRQEFGVMYKDDCLDMAVVWVHEETFNRTLGPSDSVVIRLKLATLGDKGYSR
ncbi:LPS-assembly protein [Caulobacter ginsengisoli]|uniref:LPS-assembly protein LptD n=1 Tax=Caulobacter ginsengisoli TaxID=400775 RepID=A0ABU0IPY1_9CAUL|nr:LPS-assembly protein LptD [Caulobacter ginsengisoli]MDQ0464063.1 LPS-assembly protein [Caulobacter ginsengisoli]